MQTSLPPSDHTRKHLQLSPFSLDIAAAALLVLFLCLSIALALLRHAAFHTYLLDLGYYTQVIWNTAHGRWFAASLKLPTFLADHFSPVLAALAPLFLVAPDARLLLVISILALSTGIVPAYIIAKRRDARLAVLLVACFVLNPMLHDTATQEFHEIVLAVPLLAAAVYVAITERYRLLVLSLLLVLLVREDMGIYVASFGLYFLARRPAQRRLGLLLVFLGAAWLVLMTAYVMPALGSGSYLHGQQFSGVGGSLLSALQTAVTDPGKLGQTLLTAGKLGALVRVFAPLALLPFLAGGEQLLWAPAILVLLASSAAAPGALSAWYVAPLLPLLWASIAQTLSRMQPGRARRAAALLVLTSCIGFLLWSPFPGGRLFAASTYAGDRHSQIGHQVLATIGPDESLTTQNGLGAHLGARRKLYLFPWFDWGNPPAVILLDETPPTTYPLTVEELQTSIRQLQMEPAVQTSYEQDGYVVFRVLPEPRFPSMSPLTWPAGLRMDGYEAAQSAGDAPFGADVSTLIAGGRLRVMLYLSALQKMEQDLAISVRLVAPDGRLLAQDDNWPARGLLPTSQWLPGRLIRDTHYLAIPAEAANLPLSLVVVVYDSSTGQPVTPNAGHTLTSWRAR